jgi:hypothetical protein
VVEADKKKKDEEGDDEEDQDETPDEDEDEDDEDEQEEGEKKPKKKEARPHRRPKQRVAESHGNEIGMMLADMFRDEEDYEYIATDIVDGLRIAAERIAPDMAEDLLIMIGAELT